MDSFFCKITTKLSPHLLPLSQEKVALRESLQQYFVTILLRCQCQISEVVAHQLVIHGSITQVVTKVTNLYKYHNLWHSLTACEYVTCHTASSSPSLLPASSSSSSTSSTPDTVALDLLLLQKLMITMPAIITANRTQFCHCYKTWWWWKLPRRRIATKVGGLQSTLAGL